MIALNPSERPSADDVLLNYSAPPPFTHVASQSSLRSGSATHSTVSSTSPTSSPSLSPQSAPVSSTQQAAQSPLDISVQTQLLQDSDVNIILDSNLPLANAIPPPVAAVSEVSESEHLTDISAGSRKSGSTKNPANDFELYLFPFFFSQMHQIITHMGVEDLEKTSKEMSGDNAIKIGVKLKNKHHHANGWMSPNSSAWSLSCQSISGTPTNSHRSPREDMVNWISNDEKSSDGISGNVFSSDISDESSSGGDDKYEIGSSKERQKRKGKIASKGRNRKKGEDDENPLDGSDAIVDSSESKESDVEEEDLDDVSDDLKELYQKNFPQPAKATSGQEGHAKEVDDPSKVYHNVIRISMLFFCISFFFYF
jgi:hypothetical protein